MKIKLILSVLFFSGINSFAQTFADSLINVLKKRNVTEIKSFLDKSKHKEVKALLDRQLLDAYHELTFESRSAPGYSIQLLTDKDKVIYYKVISENKNLAENEESEAVKQFYKSYAAFFGVKITIKDLFVDTVRYGRGCGFAGVDPPQRKKMQELVLARDHKELTKWLQSPVTENQLYGVEGFAELEKKGLSLSPLQKKLINFIKTKKGNYQDCNGCIYSSSAISDHFKKKIN